MNAFDDVQTMSDVDALFRRRKSVGSRMNPVQREGIDNILDPLSTDSKPQSWGNSTGDVSDSEENSPRIRNSLLSRIFSWNDNPGPDKDKSVRGFTGRGDVLLMNDNDVVPFTKKVSEVPTGRRESVSNDNFSLVDMYGQKCGNECDTGNSYRTRTNSISSTSSNNSSTSVFDDAADVLDVFFNPMNGKEKSKKYPLEIEMQTMGKGALIQHRSLYSAEVPARDDTVGLGLVLGFDRESDEVINFNHCDSRSSDGDDGRNVSVSSVDSSGFPKCPSNGLLPRMRSFRTNSGTITGRSTSNTEMSIPPTDCAAASVASVLDIFVNGAVPYAKLVLQMVERVCDVRQLLIDRAQDESFYDAIRIQPFSSGSYLRGMLISGLCNMIFLSSTLFYWPKEYETSLDTVQSTAEVVIYAWLVVLVVLNVLQIPMRIHIHTRCFTSLRTIDVDSAVATLRSLFTSDIWLLNRGIGWMTDTIAISGMIVCELYLWYEYYRNDSAVWYADPLRNSIISITTTLVLAYCFRLFIAVVFCWAMYDPQVIDEARKRGLSKWDLEILPTFVFAADNEEGSCSICLNQFDIGEILISLPCDKRHSFHSGCVKMWLQQQNSCPLCQKHV